MALLFVFLVAAVGIPLTAKGAKNSAKDAKKTW